MSNEQHEVTVYDRVPSTALLSVEQVENYLRRSGWTQECTRDDDKYKPSYWSRPGCSPLVQVSERSWPHAGPNEVSVIAAHEQRQPSAVLADIAREPES